MGYLAPLKLSSWTYFVSTICIIFIVQYQASGVGKQYITVLGLVTFFFFSVFYNQDLRSSTIEPLYEVLPKQLSEVNTRTQSVVGYESVPYFEMIRRWNMRILNTYNFLHQTCDKHKKKCKNEDMLYSIFRNMAESNNYFALIGKEKYFKYILSKRSFWENTQRDGSLIWLWKLSSKVSRQALESIAHLKHRLI